MEVCHPAVSPQPELAHNSPTLRVLWVGNSYTAWHDLPTTFAKFVSSTGGPTVEFKAYTPNGYTLGDDREDVHQLLADGPWHYIILQDQSQIPGFPVGSKQHKGLTAKSEMVLSKVYAPAAKKCGAKVLLYQTWGRKDGCQQFPELYPDFSTHNNLVKLGYNRYANCLRQATSGELDVTIAPVGEVFEAIQKNTDTLGLFPELYKEGDPGGHPSPTGSYLACMVLYATLFHNSPVGTMYYKPQAINRTTATNLQQIAAQVCLGDTLKEEEWVVIKAPQTPT
eukprot:TRINITY_DN77891_c0_g1_i1.p1 TRINITY_DN77891_c0_g1~~TRINITY_DN77891_c0_g1_i1.p1  ORF type:complete len:281 (+),score=37.00 TRINITY_DN77891_c0_g1_i1:50-892(+)